MQTESHTAYLEELEAASDLLGELANNYPNIVLELIEQSKERAIHRLNERISNAGYGIKDAEDAEVFREYEREKARIEVETNEELAVFDALKANLLCEPMHYPAMTAGQAMALEIGQEVFMSDRMNEIGDCAGVKVRVVAKPYACPQSGGGLVPIVEVAIVDWNPDDFEQEFHKLSVYDLSFGPCS